MTNSSNPNKSQTPAYQEGDAVDIVIIAKTELGYKALIGSDHEGLLYHSEVFRPLRLGEEVRGYIKKIRPDGKIDLILQQSGHAAAQEDIGPQILALLVKKGGFLAINDKTDPETIYKLFGVSKKKYKIALGGLYKKRLITVEEDGIRLVKT